MNGENGFRNPIEEHRRAMARQFQSTETIAKGEQPDVVKDLQRPPEGGFTPEQVLLMMIKTIERAAQSYGIKV